ncbi:MAG: hypothetical protein HN392_00700 [Anaerolineae bacterium]|nr:hypothetical protein [Anaerolineae bacterium]MBT7075220.1 hypothetical protein [Anaerolineae bacterium]
MPRWSQALLAILLGTIAALFYGWRIAPVEYIDLAPNTLRTEYRAEYVLMVAEIYQLEANLDLAARRLALLGSADPAEIIGENLESGDYSQEEIKILKRLEREFETWEPALAEVAP